MLCSTMAVRIGLEGIEASNMLTGGAGQSLILLRIKEKDFNMKDGAPGPPN